MFGEKSGIVTKIAIVQSLLAPTFMTLFMFLVPQRVEKNT